VASPLRAIADLVYLRKGVSWRDPLRFLTESLRIERDDLRAIDLEALEEIHDAIRSQRARRFLRALGRDFAR
jgi:hypothetical protein